MLDRFMERHVKLEGFLLRRFEEVRDHVITDRPLTDWQKLLVGAYFTLEYSLEAAALFNPSIVPHPDHLHRVRRASPIAPVANVGPDSEPTHIAFGG
jgi:hypothetical protein